MSTLDMCIRKTMDYRYIQTEYSGDAYLYI